MNFDTESGLGIWIELVLGKRQSNSQGDISNRNAFYSSKVSHRQWVSKVSRLIKGTREIGEIKDSKAKEKQKRGKSHT